MVGLWKGLENSDKQSLLVPWLKETEAISDAVFSFYMTGTDGQSYIDFGTPDEQIIGDGSEVLWLEVEADHYHWTNYVYGLKWGTSVGSDVGKE